MKAIKGTRNQMQKKLKKNVIDINKERQKWKFVENIINLIKKSANLNVTF